MNDNKNPLELNEDFVIPCKSQSSTLSAQSQEDIDYFRKKLFSALKIPKEYMNVEHAIEHVVEGPDLLPGDVFVVLKHIYLWDNFLMSYSRESLKFECIVPDTVCAVIAKVGNKHLVMPPSLKFGWAVLPTVTVRRVL